MLVKSEKNNSEKCTYFSFYSVFCTLRVFFYDYSEVKSIPGLVVLRCVLWESLFRSASKQPDVNKDKKSYKSRIMKSVYISIIQDHDCDDVGTPIKKKIQKLFKSFSV